MACFFLPSGIDEGGSNQSPFAPPPSKAQQACVSCRKQKRKCDKILPTCGLCARMARPCDYTILDTIPQQQPAQASSEELATLQARLCELENRLNNASQSQQPPPPRQPLPPTMHINPEILSPLPPKPPSPLWSPSAVPSRFPTSLFLDLDAFNWSTTPIPAPNMPIPSEVLDILSRGTTVQDTATEYFHGTHAWFPFISKKRMELGLSLWEAGPELAFLFLGMKLVSTPVNNGVEPAGNPLYTAAKRFWASLEQAGSVSLQFVQGMVLVTVYEMGQGIYPAAWISVGVLGRWVEVLGLPGFRRGGVVLGSVTTWTESEERRRLWWAIYILDRCICLGNKRCFCLPEPDESFVLPVDDKAFDEGNPTLSPTNPLPTTPFTTQALSPFTRLVQSALLLSRTLTHVRTVIQSNISNRPVPFSLPLLTSLATDLVNFTQVIQSELSPEPPSPGTTTTPSSTSTFPPTTTTTVSPCYTISLLPSLSIALSTLILLFDTYCTPENQHLGPSPLPGPEAPPLQSPSHISFAQQSMQGLRETSLKIRELSLELLDLLVLPSQEKKLSPLCLDSLYASMATLHWLWKEGGDAEVREALEDVRRCISRTSMRWRVSREYLEILKRQDVSFAMAFRAESGKSCLTRVDGS
ncbi:hypothetical protein QC764_111610 [Podospora pseudoanserina]|uniref:Zn(2)-C6 fungal-type domain-containing protein n=1 Tax=Podospora pseudoanserina TaxID=2609844 RepID=A0ABR0IP97_9PEZI|nr:hypothetical protein QC764_111610 [Podospora pseudoanserina]